MGATIRWYALLRLHRQPATARHLPVTTRLADIDTQDPELSNVLARREDTSVATPFCVACAAHIRSQQHAPPPSALRLTPHIHPPLTDPQRPLPFPLTPLPCRYNINTFSKPVHPLAVVFFPILRYYQGRFAHDSARAITAGVAATCATRP